MKKFKQFINEGKETMRELFYNPPWEPLYNFLKPIFGDSYEEAANQWMFMEKAHYLDDGLYFYKNGITRKYLVVDKDGKPFNVLKRKDDPERNWDTWQDDDLGTILIAEEIPAGQAFKTAYNDIEKFVKFASDEEKSPYLVGYNSEWKCNLYSKLKDMGYKVIGIDDTDSTEDISRKLNDAGIGCNKENVKESVKNIKWKPSIAKGVESYTRVTYPHKVTGDMVTGKTKQTWEKRLTSLLGRKVDLSYVKRFYPDFVLDFHFFSDGIEYRIYQQGENPRSSSYIIQKFLV